MGDKGKVKSDVPGFEELFQLTDEMREELQELSEPSESPKDACEKILLDKDF